MRYPGEKAMHLYGLVFVETTRGHLRVEVDVRLHPDVTASWLNWCFLMFACDIPENNDAVICISHCRDYKRTFEVVRKCAETFHQWILT